MPRSVESRPAVQHAILGLLGAVADASPTDHRTALSPASIARNTGYKDNDYVGEHCRDLDAGEVAARGE